MGEVYLARDTQLGRNVALKVLPDVFASDAERLARFRREAQVLAALHHPNIAVIHGLEDSNGIRALVLEYIDGETLADRIAAGRIPVDEALTIARQIGEALQAAHDQGVIHRDLKPSNIKLTPDGSVKVLDFGLAKLGTQTDATSGASSSVSLSPTITSPAATALGVILGTAAYMAPEQAKGKPADKRSDVWAFGGVLFEMLTGKRAFEGDDISETLASVIKGEPDWAALPADVPMSVRTLLGSCLTKDPRARLADIAGALFVLMNRVALAAAPALDVSPSSGRRLSWRLVGGGVLLLAAVVAVGGWFGWTLRPDDPLRSLVTTFRVGLAPNEQFANPGRHLLAVSWDSSRIVFAAGQRLNIRQMGQLDASPVRGTEGAGPASPRGPFFSPDGQWIGYWVSNQLKRISVNGGAPVIVTTHSLNEPYGSQWTEDDTIIYAQPDGIWRVPASGGTPALLVKADGGRRFQHPQLLPGGQVLLYTVAASKTPWDEAQIVVKPLDGGDEKHVATGADARYVPTGHLLFVVKSAIMAVPFDLGSLTTSGGAVALVEPVALANNASGAAHFDVSSTGTLVYVTGTAGLGPLNVPTWIDRQGRETPLGAQLRPHQYLRLSPDQRRVVLDVQGDNRDIYVWDVAQRAMKRLTTDAAPDRAPIFTRDNRRIIYSTDVGGFPNLFWRSADGVGPAERLTDAGDAHFPMSTAPDGTLLVRVSPGGSGGSAADIYRLSIGSERKLTPMINEEFLEQNAEISHDGRWMAFQTDKTGRNEVLVRSYPANDAEFPVSTDGGTEPLWSADDRELFYRSATGAIMRVAVRPGSAWNAGTPEQVLPGDGLRAGSQGQGAPFRTYDVSSDGRRFLVLKNAPASQGTTSTPGIIVIQNWFEELKRRVPVN